MHCPRGININHFENKFNNCACLKLLLYFFNDNQKINRDFWAVFLMIPPSNANNNCGFQVSLAPLWKLMETNIA
jgi:hypothetical protein